MAAADETSDSPTVVEPEGEVPVDRSFTGPFFQEIGKRKLDGRDAKCLVTADHAQTGVGKSNLCDCLAYICDTTDRGFSREKVTIDPPEFFEHYGVVPPGSSLVLEEGEQLDPRRAMSNKNVDASHVWQKERVREIIAFINLPSPKHIDNRIEELADFWINVEVRGRARIYKKKIHRIKQSVYYQTVQVLHWPNMDGSDTFREMGRLKMDHINDDGSQRGWVPRREMDDAIEKARKEERTKVRNPLLASFYNDTDLTSGEIAELSAVELSSSRIRQIAKEYT